MVMPLAETLTGVIHHADDTIGGEHPTFYWRRGWIGVVLLLVVEIVLHYMVVTSLIVRIAEGAVFFVVGILAIRQHLPTKTSAFLGAYVGFAAGLLFVLFELVVDPALWRVFNIIARPMWMGAMGFVITGGCAYALSRWGRRMKGGEHHG